MLRQREQWKAQWQEVGQLVKANQGDFRALLSEPLANRAADTAAASGHDDTFSVQPSHAVDLLFRHFCQHQDQGLDSMRSVPYSNRC